MRHFTDLGVADRPFQESSCRATKNIEGVNPNWKLICCNNLHPSRGRPRFSTHEGEDRAHAMVGDDPNVPNPHS